VLNKTGVFNVPVKSVLILRQIKNNTNEKIQFTSICSPIFGGTWSTFPSLDRVPPHSAE